MKSAEIATYTPNAGLVLSHSLKILSSPILELANINTTYFIINAIILNQGRLGHSKTVGPYRLIINIF